MVLVQPHLPVWLQLKQNFAKFPQWPKKVISPDKKCFTPRFFTNQVSLGFQVWHFLVKSNLEPSAIFRWSFGVASRGMTTPSSSCRQDICQVCISLWLWVCLKMLAKPHCTQWFCWSDNPYEKWLAIIGKINPTFSDKPICGLVGSAHGFPFRRRHAPDGLTSKI